MKSHIGKFFNKPFVRLLFRLAGAGVLVYLLVAAAITIAGLRENPQAADVAVVFGNKVELNGQPSPSLKSRLDRAVEVYRQGRVDRLVVSGGLGKEGYDEARVMAGYLIEQGVPPEKIFIDSQGDNTQLTAENTARLAKEHGWKSFLLISNFYHLPRAQLAFSREGLMTYTAYARRFVLRDFYYGLMREVIAYPVYWIRGQ